MGEGTKKEVFILEDQSIITLFWKRDEAAIRESKTKYGKYCQSIAYNLLRNHEDAEECENDTYLDAWKAIPPSKPFALSAFLGAITRRIAIDRFRKKHSEKRGGEETISLYELEDCIPCEKSIDDHIEEAELSEILNRFLRELPEIESNVFLHRYWHLESIETISRYFGFSQSKTKMMLKRTREKLLLQLKKEGIFV